jgi:orotate phosphoribosyltransferase
MEENAYFVSLDKNPRISIKVIPGHFATVSSHTNSYVDVSGIKTSSLAAKEVAQELAIPYLSSTLIDTIVCLENTEVIGAYLAEELLQSGTRVVNSGAEIHIVVPIHNVNGQWIFQDNIAEQIVNKNIILLTPSISSGRTVRSVLDCIKYYGGNLVGMSVLFLTSYGSLGEEIQEFVHPVFTAEDIPDFKIYSVDQCEMCKSGIKLDALINSEGYRKILPV